MNALPGERWQHNSGGVITIAAAVRRLTGVVVVTGQSNAAFGVPATFLFSDILPVVRQ